MNMLYSGLMFQTLRYPCGFDGLSSILFIWFRNSPCVCRGRRGWRKLAILARLWSVRLVAECNITWPRVRCRRAISSVLVIGGATTKFLGEPKLQSETKRRSVRRR